MQRHMPSMAAAMGLATAALVASPAHAVTPVVCSTYSDPAGDARIIGPEPSLDIRRVRFAHDRGDLLVDMDIAEAAEHPTKADGLGYWAGFLVNDQDVILQFTRSSTPVLGGSTTRVLVDGRPVTRPGGLEVSQEGNTVTLAVGLDWLEATVGDLDSFGGSSFTNLWAMSVATWAGNAKIFWIDHADAAAHARFVPSRCASRDRA